MIVELGFLIARMTLFLSRIVPFSRSMHVSYYAHDKELCGSNEYQSTCHVAISVFHRLNASKRL